MKSTLYLKFIFIYIVFGFLSLFTAATLTENLVSTPIFNRVSNSMYREALYFLASSPNQVFTREQLLDQIWGYEYIGDTRTVDVHIKRLREKIKDHNGWSLSTVWGIGYKFEVK